MEKINDLLAKVDTPEMQVDLGSSDFANGEFDVYENLARFFQPTSILEIGVYKGQSACSMIFGAKDTLKIYVGVDAEKYLKDSNLMANVHITKFLANEGIDLPDRKILLWDTQADGIPAGFSNQRFDWIHIDAGHESSEAVRDIRHFWPLTNKVLTVHDYLSHEDVKWGVERVITDNQIDYKNRFCVYSSHGFYCFFK